MTEDEDDIPTARTCPECKGAGKTLAETESTYMQLVCGWCKGTGRVPVSASIPAVTWPHE